MCTVQYALANMNRVVIVFPVTTSEQGDCYVVFEFHFSKVHEIETCKQIVIFWEVRTRSCR
jgi:hypothetical protein